LLCVVRSTVSKPQAAVPVPQVTHTAAVRAGPRMSLSKRRSSSVGNKAHLVASQHLASVPMSMSLAVSRTMSTTSLAQPADKVFPVIKSSCWLHFECVCAELSAAQSKCYSWWLFVWKTCKHSGFWRVL